MADEALIVNYYWLDKYAGSQRMIKHVAPEANWVYTERGKPHLYPDHVNASWGQDDLLVVEGDILLTPLAKTTLEDCRGDWCVFQYPLGTTRTLFPFGYGCVRWSLEFQKRFSYERVMRHGTSGCAICLEFKEGSSAGCRDCRRRMCHRHQDTAFWHEMMRDLGPAARPHVHGTVGHQHLGTRALVAFGSGIMLWNR